MKIGELERGCFTGRVSVSATHPDWAKQEGRLSQEGWRTTAFPTPPCNDLSLKHNLVGPPMQEQDTARQMEHKCMVSTKARN